MNTDLSHLIKYNYSKEYKRTEQYVQFVSCVMLYSFYKVYTQQTADQAVNMLTYKLHDSTLHVFCMVVIYDTSCSHLTYRDHSSFSWKNTEFFFFFCNFILSLQSGPYEISCNCNARPCRHDSCTVHIRYSLEHQMSVNLKIFSNKCAIPSCLTLKTKITQSFIRMKLFVFEMYRFTDLCPQLEPKGLGLRASIERKN